MASAALGRQRASDGEAAPEDEWVSTLVTVGLRDDHRICTARIRLGKSGRWKLRREGSDTHCTASPAGASLGTVDTPGSGSVDTPGPGSVGWGGRSGAWVCGLGTFESQRVWVDRSGACGVWADSALQD